MMTAEARAAWLDERRTYIGASEMAEAVGLSPWGDPISLWEQKVGLAEPKPGSFRMELGTLVEPIIGKLASEALGTKLRRVTGPIRDREYPFLASNPDFRIVGARGLVQAKFRLDGIEFGEPDESGEGLSIPEHYRVQGWGELLTTGLDFVYFAVLDPRDGLSLHLLDRRAGVNEDAIADLRLDLVEYWREYVEPRKMPPPSAMSGDALARRFPHRVAKIGKVASAEQEQTLVALLEARELLEAQKERVDLLTNTVKSWIGEAAWIEGAGRRFSWSETHRKTVAWKDVAAGYRRSLERLAEVLGDQVVASVIGTVDFETVESLYTTESENRGPFTIAKL